MDASGREQPAERRATHSYFYVKSLIDRFAALAALAALFPLMLWIVWRVQRDSRGPAIFRQVRAGRDGRPFTLLKFRTMRTDVDPFGESPRSGDDPRVTPLGRWLRETSLDELPQLINVLRGEMSLVGPRPLYMQQMAEWNERQRGRLRVPPGLTGLAQIEGRGGLTIEEKLEWDVRYAASACLRTDVLILLRTVTNVLRRSGIYEVRYSERAERRGAG
jgi:lipopolysaccharide/colanic/teichoic acid biosynthesis glycosyltransferase